MAELRTLESAPVLEYFPLSPGRNEIDLGLLTEHFSKGERRLLKFVIRHDMEGRGPEPAASVMFDGASSFRGPVFRFCYGSLNRKSVSVGAKVALDLHPHNLTLNFDFEGDKLVVFVAAKDGNVHEALTHKIQYAMQSVAPPVRQATDPKRGLLIAACAAFGLSAAACCGLFGDAIGAENEPVKTQPQEQLQCPE